MPITKRKLIVSSVLSIGLFLSAFNPSTAAKAEEGQEIEALMDFSIDLDDLPPQPSQSASPEINFDLETPDVSDVTVDLDDSVSIDSAVVDAQILSDIISDDVVSLPNDTVSKNVVPEVSAPLTPLNSDLSDAVDPMGLDAPETGGVTHSGLYYEAGSLVPNSALKGAVGPREVDPKYEPASRFVVVTRGAGPNSTQARIVAVQRALKLGRYTAALELGEALYKKNPKNKHILMSLAVAQQHSGFTASAIATYEELLSLDPKNTNAMVNMLGLIKKQYPAVAYRKLKELWANNSLNPGLAAQLGITSASMGDFEGALHYLSIAASIEPNNASHYYNMAVVSDQAGAYKDAMELYQKSLEVDVTFGGSRSVPRDKIYDRLARLRRL